MPKKLLDLALKRKITPEEFEKNLRTISTGIERKGRNYKGTKVDPIRIFRSRLFETQKLPVALKEYSYRENEFCKLGRANEQHKSIFYASAGGPTTFVETRCNVGDIIVVSEFRCYRDLLLQEIGLLETENKPSEFEEMLHEIFTHPDEQFYTYSSKIAKHLMNGKDLHGIIYPSIISNNQSHNLAIKPDFVDKFLSHINCTAYKINKIKTKFSYDVDEIDFGINEQNSIIWKGRKKRWTIKENGASLKMKSNGWQWDAFDINNRLVDPG